MNGDISDDVAKAEVTDLLDKEIPTLLLYLQAKLRNSHVVELGQTIQDGTVGHLFGRVGGRVASVL
jgi:hypothetical protein